MGLEMEKVFFKGRPFYKESISRELNHLLGRATIIIKSKKKTSSFWGNPPGNEKQCKINYNFSHGFSFPHCIF
jgi:hypothetical protein